MSESLALARVQLQRGEAGAAADLLGPVLAAEPDHVAALVLMTHAQLALEKPELAHEVAARAVQHAPGSAEALTALSRALTALGRHDEAITMAQAAVARQADNPYRHNRLAWALLEEGSRPVEAEHAAREAVRLDPDEADFRITYAMVMKQLNLPQRAQEALRDALKLDPENAIARHELAAFDVAHRNPFALRRLARGVTGLVAALRADPRQEASRHLLDAALRQFLVYTAIIMVVFAYLGWRVSDDSTLWARVLAASAALAPAGYAGYFLARLDRVLRTYLKEVLWRQRAASFAAALALALLLTATVAPAGWLPILLGVASVTGFGVRLLTSMVPRK